MSLCTEEGLVPLVGGQFFSGGEILFLFSSFTARLSETSSRADDEKCTDPSAAGCFDYEKVVSCAQFELLRRTKKQKALRLRRVARTSRGGGANTCEQLTER